MEAIVAFGNNFGIGQDGVLPWNVPRDMKHFRQITEGHTLVMGRKTFESLPRPLTNRTIIVVTSSVRPDDLANNVLYRTIDAVQGELARHGKVFIAGGEQIYRYFMPQVNTLHATRIHTNVDRYDTFFPAEHLEEFAIEAIDKETECTFLTYKRVVNSKS